MACAVRSVEMTLPSGRRARVRASRRGTPLESDTVDGRALFAGRALAAMIDGHVVIEVAGRPLDREAILALSTRDFHALREAATRLGAIVSAPEQLTCRNCDEAFTMDPASADLAELEERYEHDDTPTTLDVQLPRPLRLKGGGRASEISLREVTVREAMPLWAAVVRPGPLDVTAAVVAALGVVAAGETRDAATLARALSRAPDDVWRAVEQGYLSLAYSDRAFYPVPCPACGALHEVDAPLDREIDADDQHAVSGTETFPTEEAFESLVERVAPEVYARRGVQNVAIRVEPGVPDVDDGGEPLLGSYEPRTDADGDVSTGAEFLVTVYYRTFRKMWDEDGPYDLDAELRDTIDHELEHHLYYLDGHDPLDDDERRETRADLERTFGKKTVARAQRRALLTPLLFLAALFALGLLAYLLAR